MRNIQAVTRAVTRAVSTSAPRRSVSMKEPLTNTQKGVYPADPSYATVRALQNDWNETSRMVWEKRGVRDSGPYNLTMLLTAVATVVTIGTLGVMSFPKPPQ